MSIKIARTDHPVAETIAHRWSPRAFKDQPIDNQSLNQLFEAARWAASANNEQPWYYLYAHKGSNGFTKIVDCLMPGNQPWAKNASVILIAAVRKTFEANGKENPYAWHDLGMANATLLLQATHMQIAGHFMAGVDKQKLSESLNLDENLQIVGLIALGFRADAATLDEPYKSREEAARTRKPIAAFTKEL